MILKVVSNQLLLIIKLINRLIVSTFWMYNRVWEPLWVACWVDRRTSYPKQSGAEKLWVEGCGRRA